MPKPSHNQVSESTFLRILYEFSASLIQISDLDDLLWHVAREVVGQLGFEDCVIYLLDEDTDCLVQMAAIGEKNPQAFEIRNRLVIPVGRGVTGRVAESATPTLLDDAWSAHDYIPDMIDGASELCVPILFDGKVLGVIDSEDPRPGYYNQQHLQFLESVASLLGSKIQQIRLSADLNHAERERVALLEIASMHTKFKERRPYFERLQQILSSIIPLDRITVAMHTEQSDTVDIPLAYENGCVYSDQTAPLQPSSMLGLLLEQPGSQFLHKEQLQALIDSGELEPTDQVPSTVLGVQFELNEHTRGLLVVSGDDITGKPRRSDLGFLSLICRSLADAYRFEQSRIKRARAERQLAVSESRLRSIIENAPMAISLKSPDGKFLAVGNEFCRINKVTAEELIGLEDIPNIDPNVAETVRELEKEVRTSKTVARREIEQMGSDGRQRYTILTKFPILDDAGELVAIGGIGADITEQRHTEHQLMQAQRMEVVGQLTGGIAHDFNNLLMAISGGVERAQDIARGDKQLEPILELIRKGAERGSDLTRRLSVFSRMQVFDREPADVGVLVDGAAKLIKHAVGSSVHLEIDTADDTWHVMTDQRFFEHALLNLAINANDAMPDGGRLRIDTSNVTHDAPVPAYGGDLAAGDFVKISVSDTGEGMPEDVQHKAFEPFFTTKEVGKGSGLGLSMVFGFIKQCGGCINIESAPAAGTSIHLYLPRTSEAPNGNPEDQLVTGKLPGGTARILVVEDESSIRELLQHFLRESGHDATIVGDGQSAMAVLDEQARKFDLLITDVALPMGMNGRDVAAGFLAANGGGEVIYISGYAEDAVVRSGKFDDGHAFLAKPFTRDSLTSKIAEVLKQ